MWKGEQMADQVASVKAVATGVRWGTMVRRLMMMAMYFMLSLCRYLSVLVFCLGWM